MAHAPSLDLLQGVRTSCWCTPSHHPHPLPLSGWEVGPYFLRASAGHQLVSWGNRLLRHAVAPVWVLRLPLAAPQSTVHVLAGCRRRAAPYPDCHKECM